MFVDGLPMLERLKIELAVNNLYKIEVASYRQLTRTSPALYDLNMKVRQEGASYQRMQVPSRKMTVQPDSYPDSWTVQSSF